MFRRQCKRLGVYFVDIFLFEREILIFALVPCLYTVIVVGACGVIRLAGAVDADERFIATEVDDNAHFRNQPHIKIFSGMVGRRVESIVVAGSREWAPVKITGKEFDAVSFNKANVL